MKLGKLPPKHDVRTLRFGRYGRTLPPAPAACDYSQKVPAWPMLGNDEYGDCTFAGAAHMSQCWADNAGRSFTPDDRAVVGEYLSFTGGADTGCVELDVLKHWRVKGIVGDKHKPPHPAGTFLRWERDIGVEMISIPARYWKWSGGPNTILEDDLPIGVRVPVATHTLVWSNVVAPPYETIRASRGTVNADAILGASPGCLLFVGAKITEIYQLDGTLRYTLQYVFTEKTVPLVSDPETVVGHNYFYYGPGSDGENWFPVVSVTGGHAVYPSTEFAPLFQYE